MKICIITTVHSVLDERIFHKEAVTLKRFFRITIIGPNKENISVDGIRIIALPVFKNRLKRIFFQPWYAYRLAVKIDADIYHFHDPELLPWMLRLKKRTGARVVYDVHEDVPKSILSKPWIPARLRVIISIIVNFLEKTFAKDMDLIISATPEINARFKNNAKVVLRNYPLRDLIENVALMDVKKSKPVAVYSGGITKIRGIVQICEAVCRLDGKMELWLMGSFFPKDFKEELSDYLKKSFIHYKGYMPFEKMYSVMKSVDMGLILFLPEPNHVESLPNKLFEYMAAGIPIVASNFPVWKTIIEQNNCGICVDPCKPEDIAEAIMYLVSHPEEAKIMGENGRKAVRESYNWEKESEKLISAYEKLK